MSSGSISGFPSARETAPGGAELEIVDLHAGYGKSGVLFGVTLRAAPGEVVAVLGRNGAGKSTTLKAIMGLATVSRGQVRLRGRDLAGLAPHRIAQAGIGYVPQERRIFGELSVAENLTVGRRAGRSGGAGWTIERIGTLFPALGELADRRGGALSGGEQQMLAVARTLMGNPDVLLLDEPSEGLAPIVVAALVDQVRRLKNEGLTILLSEQNLRFTGEVSDRLYILEKGRIRHEGTPRSILTDPRGFQELLTP
jgi:branched-chain amino acid transport system ATP-binding protein